MIKNFLSIAALVGLSVFGFSAPTLAEVERVETQATDSPGGGAQEYLDKVAAKRAKYGNSDGVRHATLLNGNRFGFSLGYMTWTGGNIKANGPHFGLNYIASFNDNVGMEMWGGYGLGSEETGTGAIKAKLNVGRLDYSIGVRGQMPISLGEADRSLVPFLSVGPVYSYIHSTSDITGFTSVTSNDSSLGFSVAPGIDMFMGGISFGLKANYIVSQNLGTGGGDTSAFIPQFTVGWTF